MVEHGLRPQEIHHPVKPLGGNPFEKGILFPGGTDAIDNGATLAVLLHHGIHRIHIILEVGVHGHCHVTAVPGSHEPGQQGILMTPVPAQVHP